MQALVKAQKVARLTDCMFQSRHSETTVVQTRKTNV